MINKNEKRNFQLYIVATPIGNRQDLSFRAIEILKNADIIACEDCRTSSALLEYHKISTKLVSYHKFNEKQRTTELLDLINQGKTIALISDAGTPCISDPGRVLVKELRDKGVEITSIPGACAITAFVSQIPRDNEEFAFIGFLPRVKNQQEKIFQKYKYTDTVFYESANRLIETLQNILNSRGENTKIAVGRELTKMFEEIKTGNIKEIIDYYKTNALKGEIVAMIYACEENETKSAELIDKIQQLKKSNFSDKDISKILSSLYNVNKNKVYELSVNLK